METTAPVPGTQRRPVPLTCNICSKRPKFSDLSHLLTHISSKAHLSTYYKVKVRSAADSSSRQQIEQYDIWYAEYDIEALMSERLSLKEERKGRAARVKSESRPRQSVKKEAGSQSRSVTPYAGPFFGLEPSSLAQHANPYAQVHPANPYAQVPQYHMWAPTPFMFGTNGEDDDELSSGTSTVPARVKAESRRGRPDADEDEASKLKGVYWPGMGLFDAATPELKKKRNQKKDVSVNDRLAAVSQEIERTELVFSPSGSLRKSRPISGLPASDSDPLPGEESPPRPRKTRRAPRRKPLEEKDPNAATRPTRGKARKKNPPRPAATKPEPFGEGVIDDQSTYDTQQSRRKKGSVYRDQEVSFDQPAPMSHLTAGYQQPMMYQAAAPMDFRSAEPTYMPAQSYYQFPTGYHGAPFSYDPSPMATWDFYGHGAGASIANPLFSGLDGLDDEDDGDEETISAPVSESDK